MDRSGEVNHKIHFTYTNNPDMASLCQGDILEKTSSLLEVLGDVHPYFLNPQYRYFIVLTQSCDLVRRNGKQCKSPYITLSAVRSLDAFLKYYFINNRLASEVNGLLLMDSKNKTRAYQFIERLFNNTEADYFFLAKEEMLNFPESMVASLKVSIALKSDKHYDCCLAAKRIELAPEFQAKLGWLVGNIYSRVGTPDWESIMSEAERKQMLFTELESRFIIGEKEQIDKLKKALSAKAPELHSRNDALEYIASIPVQSRYDQVIGILEEIINTSSSKIPKEEKARIISTIKSRQKLATILNKP